MPSVEFRQTIIMVSAIQKTRNGGSAAVPHSFVYNANTPNRKNGAFSKNGEHTTHRRFRRILEIIIPKCRKIKELSQKEPAEGTGISRSLISAAKVPRLAYNFTLDVLLTWRTRSA